MIIKNILKIGIGLTIILTNLSHADEISELFKKHAINESMDINTSSIPTAIINNPTRQQTQNTITPIDNTSFEPLLLITPSILPDNKQSIQIKPTEVNNKEIIKPTEVNNKEIIKPTEVNNKEIIKPTEVNNKEIIKPTEVNNKEIIKSTEVNNNVKRIEELNKQEQIIWVKLKDKTSNDSDYLELVTSLNQIGIEKNTLKKSLAINVSSVDQTTPSHTKESEVKFIQNSMVQKTTTLNIQPVIGGKVIFESIDLFDKPKDLKKSKIKLKSKSDVDPETLINDQSISTSNAISTPIK